ncbi:hypothetical protein LZ31DRAFT_620660 [Colletotrichum somersetense]|nr:hypothetical protein LZ31DRAFT_620660 [Colletotrichum somersetense]
MVLFGRGSAASLYLVAAAVTSVLSAPLSEVDFAYPPIVARQGRVADKLEQLCNHDLSKESQDDIWWKNGVGLTLDLWVKREYNGWVQNLDKFVWKKTGSNAWDCTDIPRQCGPPADCHVFRDVADSPDEYWIFKPGSVKDLTDIYAKVAAALNIGAGLASGLKGPGPLVGGALTSIGGIFSLAASKAPTDPKPLANAYLAAYFSQARSELAELALNLLGGEDGDQNKLPKRQAIGISVLGSHGWKFFIDTSVKNQGDCTKAERSRIWKGGVNECWGLLKWTPAPLGDPFSNKAKIQVENPPEKIFQGMEQYEMYLTTIYDNAVSCKLAQGGSDRTINLKNLSLNGGRLPECFFNIDVAKGFFTTFEYKAQDLWGKW